MNIKPCSFIAGICLFAAIRMQCFAVDATYNNLEVDGQGDFTGPNTTFGTSGTINPGLTLNYTDGATGTINFVATPSSDVWQWAVTSGTSAFVSMKLDAGNQLILYTTGTSGTAGITLNPAGTSTFAGSITAGGTNNTLPDQQLISGSSILTESLGDGRYLTQSAGDARYALSGSSASFSSLRISSGTVTNGGFVAIGAITNASGSDAVAIGYADAASGLRSMAFGAYTTASGNYSTTFGAATTASSFYSTALGLYTTASGNYSVAMGDYTTAQGYDEVVIGQYNILQGSGTNWVATDDLFTIGNGSTALSPSDAFVVQKNGNTTVYGNFGIGLSGSTSPSYTQQLATGTNGNMLVQQVLATGSGSWQWLSTSGTSQNPVMNLDNTGRLTVYSGTSHNPMIVLDPSGNGLITVNGQTITSVALDQENTWTGQQTFNTAPIMSTVTAGSVFYAETGGQVAGTTNATLDSGGNFTAQNGAFVSSIMHITPGPTNGGPSVWIDMGPGNSGIGTGGSGATAWMGQAGQNGAWFIDSLIGDIASRNIAGRILIGTNNGGDSSFGFQSGGTYQGSNGDEVAVLNSNPLNFYSDSFDTLTASINAATGGATFTGPVHLEPQGDLAMGDFTYDPDDGGDEDMARGLSGGMRAGAIAGSRLTGSGTATSGSTGILTGTGH